MPSQRLVICLDGTWNVRDDTTNVWRIYALTAEEGEDGRVQHAYYDQGVGTAWYDRFTGGAFGAGMYTIVRRAYNWLCERYRPDDEIFIFGFSRGAATALSLANLVDRCGIVGPESRHSFEDSYRLYAKAGFSRKTWASTRIRSRAADTGYYPLKFLGLFDTVASLYLRRLTQETIHVLRLPDSARHVVHAIAIDENRSMFQSVSFPSAPLEGALEERWFSGAHANVGGGYRYDALAIPPLAWIMNSASDDGLTFRGVPSVSMDEVLASMERNSHDEFAGGWLPLIPGTKKPREVGRKAGGRSRELVDETVIKRCLTYPGYFLQCRPLHRLFPLHSHIPLGEFDVSRTIY